MDISANISNTKLKVRVAGILSTSRGFLFEKGDQGYIFPVGGKVMINETSDEAIRREVIEEVGMHFEEAKLVSVIENLYATDSSKIHEICFVYKIKDIFTGAIPRGFIEVPITELRNFEIKPNKLVDIFEDNSDVFKHFIIK